MSTNNPLFKEIGAWFGRTFSDPETISLFMVLLIGFLLIEFLSSILMPMIISIIFAYLLNSVVNQLMRLKCPRWIAVWVVYLLFLGVFIYAMLYIFPLLWRQLSTLINALPNGFSHGQIWINYFIEKHPKFSAYLELDHLTEYLKEQTPKFGQTVLHFIWLALPNLAEVIIYIAIVPFLVFFLLKDKITIINWLKHYLPRRRTLLKKVSLEVYRKIGSYVRGRVIEVLLVSIVTSISFTLLGMPYALLFGALIGVSILVPYIGTVLVTVPVVTVALMQWGFAAHFWVVMIVFTAIIILDGNILFPLLFSRTMDLHPLVIILAVIFFGKLWGFWGIFFAIPLATLVNAVIKVWPRHYEQRQ